MSSRNQEMRFVIGEFDPAQDIPADIAFMHLCIRSWQESVGQKHFQNIQDSQLDLRALQEAYLDNGGNFFVAREYGQIIGFVGLRSTAKAGELLSGWVSYPSITDGVSAGLSCGEQFSGPNPMVLQTYD